MNKTQEKQAKKARRKAKIRAKIGGTKEVPRLSVFRSNTSIFLQIIDDSSSKTIVSAHSREIKVKKEDEQTRKVAIAFELGKLIAKKAIDKKIVNENAALSKKQILDLIFLPGFSTAKAVSDLSGRGVGMDVVRKKISQIRGVVEVESEQGKGITVIIKLPLSLSIIDGLQILIEDTHYIIPLSSVYKIYSVNHSKIAKAFNDLIVLDGKP